MTNSRKAGRRDPPPIWVGLLFVLAGATIMLVAADIIPHDEADVHAPHRVLALAGAAFFFAGVAVVLLAFGLTQHDARYVLVAALAITTLAAPFNWIAFGPGERQFSGGFSFFGLSLFGENSGEIEGRVAFGIGALLADAIAIFAWRDFLKKLHGAIR